MATAKRMHAQAQVRDNSYQRLLTKRWAEGLLLPFTCFGCGQCFLDSLGREGKHEYLCERCADSRKRT
jgi:hypothetical protein